MQRIFGNILTRNKIYKLMLQDLNDHESLILLPADIEDRLRPIYDMVMYDDVTYTINCYY